MQHQLEEQEREAHDAISKWQESYTASEGRCTELEAELKLVISEKNKFENKLKSVEKTNESISSGDCDHGNPENSSKPLDQIFELQEALKAAQETLARDEEVVQQWEGK
jgi:hypothetical protein